jgi:hypothetical protein
MRRVLRRLVNRFRYRRFDDDIAEELRFHREMKEQELRGRLTESGGAQRMSNPTAVSREMGNELRMRERAREVWVAPGMTRCARTFVMRYV